MLLYIHVPFCQSKCRYCAFYSQAVPAGDEQIFSQYLSTLEQELLLWGERLGSVPVETIFLGGGTPSMLPERAVANILERIAKTFAVAENAEISMEANPESALAPSWLLGVQKAGVNRLSFGVQSLDNTELAVLGRAHTAEQARIAVEAARAANFSRISLDLMWGLPWVASLPRPKDQGQWLRCLEAAVCLEPEHISAYALTLEPDTELFRLHATGILTLPDDEAQATMFEQGAEYLEAHGYMQYEVSNFARFGGECQHNLGYWAGKDYLGLGPAAVSTLRGQRWGNPANIHEWRIIVEQQRVHKRHGTPAPLGLEVEVLDESTQLRELLMLRLRTVQGLSLRQWEERSGKAFTTQFEALVQQLQQSGLGEMRQGYFRLTRAGLLVSNAVIEHFFALCGTEHGRECW